MALPKLLTTGQGAPGAAGWHPTVVYLILLTIVEMAVFGFISKALR